MYFEYISFGYIGDVSDYAYEPFDHFYMKMEVLFECTCEEKSNLLKDLYLKFYDIISESKHKDDIFENMSLLKNIY